MLTYRGRYKDDSIFGVDDQSILDLYNTDPFAK